MATNELRTDFIFNADEGLRRVDLTKRSLLALNNELNNFGKTTVVGKTIANDFDQAGRAADTFKNKVNNSLKAPTDNSLKNALNDIKRMQSENIAGEKAVTRSIEREAKLQADAKIREGKRAANEALRTLNTQNRTPTAQGLNLSAGQKQNLYYQANDVLTQAALGQSPLQIAASQGGQIAQTFSGAQAAALVAAYGSLVTIAAAGATAIALTYKLTGDLRDRAEKRLGVENSISAAINKQVIGLRESNAEYEKFKRSLDQARSFSDRISSAVNTFDASAIKKERDRIDEGNKSLNAEINRLQADLAQKERSLEFAKNRNVNQGVLTGLGFGREYTEVQKQEDVRKAENAVEKTRKLLAESENALQTGKSAFQQTNQALSDITTKQNEAFNQRNEIFKKSQQIEIEFQQKATEAQRKFQIEVEKGKEKVNELGKTYKSVFDSLSLKTNSNNPLVSVFIEARNELEKLKESLKGLPADLQQSAIRSQQAINRNKLFETRIDNNLSALDLRETANRFRNPQSDTLVEKQRFEEIVKSDIRRGLFFSGGAFGTFGSNLAISQGGDYDKLTADQKRSIYEVIQLKNLRGDGGVNDRSLISRLASERIGNGGENLNLNERLQKQLSIINSGVTNESERGIADRKLIGLTSGLDPAQIKADLREQIAAANERESGRREKYESELLRVQQEDLQINKKLLENQEKLLKIAEKEGFDGLNQFLEITVKDETRGGVSTGSSGTMADVAANYFESGF